MALHLIIIQIIITPLKKLR